VRSSTSAQNETALDEASNASEPEANVAAQGPAINWPQPAKSPGITTSFERETPRSTDLIAPTPAPAPANLLPAATAVHTQVKADWPSPVIVITLSLLALFGPMYYAACCLRRRKTRDRWNTERSYWSAPDEPDTHAETGLAADSREQIAETLQKLLDEMQTKLYATSDEVRPMPEAAPDQNRGLATNHIPTIRLAASSR
jgi:hypothetical protein